MRSGTTMVKHMAGSRAYRALAVPVPATDAERERVSLPAWTVTGSLAETSKHEKPRKTFRKGKRP